MNLQSLWHFGQRLHTRQPSPGFSDSMNQGQDELCAQKPPGRRRYRRGQLQATRSIVVMGYSSRCFHIRTRACITIHNPNNRTVLPMRTSLASKPQRLKISVQS